jgi:hypothetical protein
MNATQLNQLRKEGRHREHKRHVHPSNPQQRCWCGLCHCHECQTWRAAESRAAANGHKNK